MIAKNAFYKRRIIKQLYFGRSYSCAQISMAIDKSLPLTAKILNELIKEGYVIERGLAASSGGRRPITYSLRQDVLFIIAVAMDQYVTRIALMDMGNAFVTKNQKFELSLASNPGALSILTNHINQFITESGIAKEKIAGIGIGMPGFVDSKKGINYTFLPAGSQSISEHITRETGLLTFIDNDSSLIALAELHFGGAKRRKSAMVVNLSWGVGLGMLLNGEMYRGHNGFAGEFSHIPIFTNGKLCSCGKTGCLETETSLLIIIEKAKERLEKGNLSILKADQLGRFEEASERIMEAVHQGDRFAAELFSEVAYNIGRGLAILIHIMNPEVIILSGRGAAAGKIWLAPIQQALNVHSIPRLAEQTIIEMSTLGYEAELIGAASLVMEHFENESIITKTKTGTLSQLFNHKSLSPYSEKI